MARASIVLRTSAVLGLLLALDLESGIAGEAAGEGSAAAPAPTGPRSVTAPPAIASKPTERFVDLATVAPGIAVEMRYATADNFMGRPARGYGAPRCLLTREAAR